MRRAVLIAALAACGGSAPPPPIAVPPRAATAGDAVWSRLPAGAALVLEVDLARLRANPAVGAMARQVIDGGAAPTPAALIDAELVVLAAYRLGRPDAHTITVVRGGHRPAIAIELGGALWALADEGVTPALLQVAPEASMASDHALLAARAAVMPAAADGAAVRAVARLDADARRGFATMFAAAAPTAAALWLDVADDLAAVAWVDGVDRAAMTAWRDRLAGVREVVALGVSPAVAAAEVTPTRGGVTATVVIGPARLARAVARWQASTQAP